MAKKASTKKPVKAKKAAVDAIPVPYRLSALPTVQHRAGLAGLVLELDFLRQSDPDGGAGQMLGEIGRDEVTVTFTEAGLRELFDHLYDARKQTVSDGKKEFDVVKPAGHFLKHHLADGDGFWLNLWRRMLWAIPRGRPTTRIPFNARADGKPCAEGPNAWKDLAKAASKQQPVLDELSGALLLGAQAVNAETVPFQGRVEENLLLHFWPLTTLTFVPVTLDRDGKASADGYALAVPDVSDLKSFRSHYPRMLRRLPVPKPGSRLLGGFPPDALIALPQQGALELMEDLIALAGDAAGDGYPASIRGVEVAAMVKEGQNAKSRGLTRIAADPRRREEYRAVKASYRHPLFVEGLVRALLDGPRTPWYAYFGKSLQSREAAVFLHRDTKAVNLCDDAANKFQSIQRNLARRRRLFETLAHRTGDPEMKQQSKQRSLEEVIYDLARVHVEVRALNRLGKTDDEAKKLRRSRKDRNEGEAFPGIEKQQYATEKEKACTEFFLSFRSRRGHDFVADFCNRFGPFEDTFLTRAEYLDLARELQRPAADGEPETTQSGPDRIKTLSLLALSALSGR
ncbi:MAG: type I-MYXAN CRISPR-associated protein Cmx8 [Planctomycetaceae bacterium]